MRKLFLIFVFMLLASGLVFGTEWRDDFCPNSTYWQKLNHTASVFEKYYCDVDDSIGLNDSFSQTGYTGDSEMNISVGDGESYITVSVPMGVLLEFFNISLEGVVLHSDSTVPVGAVVVTDTSGSMGSGSKMADAKQANHDFVDTLFNDSDPDTQMGLTSYTNTGSTDMTLTTNEATLHSVINGYSAGGGTCIHTGMSPARNMLNGYTLGNKAMIVMTDGHDGCDSGTLSESTAVGNANISLYTIGFGSGADMDHLHQMAENANGQWENYSYYAPSGDELSAIYQQIAHDISHSEPEDVSIYVGGNMVWYQSGPVGNQEVDLNQWIMDIARNGCHCTSGCANSSDGNYCLINISFTAGVPGNITLSNLEGGGSYGLGMIVSEEIDALELGNSFSQWDKFCFSVDVIPNTNVWVRLVRVYNGGFFALGEDDCDGTYSGPTCQFDSGVVPGRAQPYCFDISDLDPSVTSVALMGVLNSTDVGHSPRVNWWNVSFLASEPVAVPGGPYECISGDASASNIPTFNGSDSYEPGACTPDGTPCSSQSNEDACESIGCFWTPANCGGTCTNCAHSDFDSESECTLQEGCSWTQGGCSGPVTPCESYTTEFACNGQDGCNWGGSSGICSGSCICATPVQSTCESNPACWWDLTGKCDTGGITPVPMSGPDQFNDYNPLYLAALAGKCCQDTSSIPIPKCTCGVYSTETECQTMAGCSWLASGSAGCEGTATECDSLGNEKECDEQGGCTWSPQECRGSCVPCFTYGDQTSCDNQGGCSWSGSSSCDAGPSCTGLFEFQWEVSNKSWKYPHSLTGPEVNFSDCWGLEPGSYEVVLDVENTDTGIHGQGPTILHVRPPKGELRIDDLHLIEPVVKDYKSSSSVSVINVGGQEETYTLTLEVKNGSDFVVHTDSYPEGGLSGESLRKRTFVWTPTSSGEYTVNATLYNASGFLVDQKNSSVMVGELSTSGREGFEYPYIVLLIVLIAVPLFAFYFRKQE